MIAARSVDELQRVGLDHVAVDLSTPAGCARAVGETEQRLGPIDILVVNHGIGTAHERLIWEQDPQVWRQTLQVNLDSPFELARGISTEQVWQERASLYPRKRVLEPIEVAQVIAYLCSDAAAAINGEAVTVALGGVW